MGRILIFTGKGGVGKTSMASSHALLSAKEGKKTLIVSTDMAHNLCDIFETKITKQITPIRENLDALEIDPDYMIENEYQDMFNAFSNMMTSTGMPLGTLEQLSLFPGMDELFSLLKILDVYKEGRYERIIVDCAPTGETLTLLKFPELLSWYMEKFFPIGKIAMRVLSPVSKVIFKVQLPDKNAMTDIEKLFLRLIELQDLLKDKSVTSVRLVAMPEKMVVEETKRNYMYMNLYDFNVDGVYINRILPKDIDNPFFDEWLEIQSNYIEELEAIFTNVPLYPVPWFDSELSGLSGIEKITDKALSMWDVFEVKDIHKGLSYQNIDEGYLMKIYLPTIESKDLDMHESNTDIIIKVGNFKRNIPKPNALRNHQITGAKFIDEYLHVILTAM